MRYFFLAYLFAIVIVLGFAGFRGDKFTHTPMEIFDDMDQQAKVKAQQTNFFFADGNAGRKPVVGTVPMGLHVADKSAAEGGFQAYGFTHGSDFYNTGAIGAFYGDGFPAEVKVDATLVRLGRERYDIHCYPCHGQSGNAVGVMAKHGIPNIANFHAPAFTNPADPAYRPNGSIFETITKGKGLMGAYGPNIPVKERWAIIAWIRTMQLARTAPLSDPLIKEMWEIHKPKTTAAAPAAPAPGTPAPGTPAPAGSPAPAPPAPAPAK
ncbi:MAG TPA: cytochrome c [Verrucomicrobiales bacterium]|jgi:mono/diheme cytochrome c family protein|nr:cytochrome c [Verrucomicrobiales bacterium]